jgi:hypothetical protein
MTNVIARVSAVVLLVSLWLPLSASAQLTKLRAAYSAESSWSLATWVAYDGGYFKKYGLDLDLVLIRSASIITAALLAGEAPMIQLGGNDVGICLPRRCLSRPGHPGRSYRDREALNGEAQTNQTGPPRDPARVRQNHKQSGISG